MIQDIVCGMGVDDDAPETFIMTYHGARYFFCSADCLQLFSKKPEEYIDRKVKPNQLKKDVVCGMEVDMQNTPFMTEHEGVIYFFCSDSCRQEFLRNPEQFVKKLQ